MKIEVNITKTRFFVLLLAILLLGVAGVVYAFGTNSPSKFGHSVGEVDWSQTIPSDVKVQGTVSVNGQKALSADDNAVRVGDLTSGDGLRNLILKAGDADRMIVNTGGDVGIGTLTPGQKLDVDGNIFATGKIYNDNSCRIILQSTKNGENTNVAINVPDECKDNDCLVFLRSNSWAAGAFSYVHYKQQWYNIPGGSNIVVWGSNNVGEKRANEFAWDASSEASGINGDSTSTLFLKLHKGDSNSMKLFDDSNIEKDANQWSLFNYNSPPFDIIVCS